MKEKFVFVEFSHFSFETEKSQQFFDTLYLEISKNHRPQNSLKIHKNDIFIHRFKIAVQRLLHSLKSQK
jgi:hypothetical protein